MKPKIFSRENTNLFAKSLIQGGSYLFIVLSLFFLYLYFTTKYDISKLVFAIISAVVFVALRAVLTAYYTKPQKNQDTSSYKFFFSGLRVIIVIVLLLGILGVYHIFTASDCGSCAVYQAIGLGIIVIWACVFLSYFVWAVYYYNINLGLPEEEWNKIFEAKERKARGESYSVENLEEEPKYNPYKEETFGLPGGTVRGMIAFTLLFGAISMLIVSIGMENQLDSNSMFWDQYEFFKTAFLMMIAFYFGSRSLQYLTKSGNSTDNADTGNQQNTVGEAGTTNPPAGQTTQVGSKKKPDEKNTKPPKKEPNPDEPTLDPQNPKK